MHTLARQRDQAQILGRVRGLRPECARRWGRMSIGQMVCHVGDALRMALGQHPVRLASGPLQRTLVKWTALYLPLPWPAGIPTSPEIDQEQGGTRPTDFAADLARVEALLQQLTREAASLDGRRHPIFGRLTRDGWLRWAYLHTDHHLRQFGA